MRTRLLVAAAIVTSSCNGDVSAPAASRRQCLLFLGLSKTVPEGGVPISIDVPREWTEVRYEDGSCSFRPSRSSEGHVTVNLELCISFPGAPCDSALDGRTSVRDTDDTTLLGQTMRISKLKIADPRSHNVAQCSAVVQGTQITRALADQLARLERICDSMTIEMDPSRRSY